MKIYPLYNLYLVLFITVLLPACVTNNSDEEAGPECEAVDVSFEGTFAMEDMQTVSVFSFYHRNNILFAGTDAGVFKKDINLDNNGWANLGLGSDTTEVIDIIAWDGEEIMAVIQYEEYHSDNDVIRKTEDGGKTWVSLTENFTGENITNFLKRLTFDIESPDRIYALGGLPVARSTDRGQSWKAVFETWQLAAFGEFITIDPQNSNVIWSGGETNIFTPSLIKSTNKGSTWKRLQVIEKVESSVYDLMVSCSDSEQVLAGLGGSVPPARVIRRSTDGGESWQTVFENINTYTFTRSARSPQAIYASGRNAAGILFFAVTTNFGDTWEVFSFENGPTGIRVNDMASVMVDGKEILYFGTNKGVFSYTFEK